MLFAILRIFPRRSFEWLFLDDDDERFFVGDEDFDMVDASILDAFVSK
jgi:hypothetical protein